MTEDAQLNKNNCISSKIQGNTVIKSKRMPPNAGKGRPKGSPNKATRTLREAIIKAFDDLGGVEWVKTLAEEDTRAFVMLLVRVIPPPDRPKEEGKVTLEDLLEMANLGRSSQEEVPPRRPLDLPCPPTQIRSWEPPLQPRLEPLPAHDGPNQKRQEQLPGQAPGSHLRPVMEYPSPSVGTSISDAYDPLA